MKRKVIGICATLLTFSAAMIGSALAINPNGAQAVTATYNVGFNQTSYLPNGYTVQMIGMGMEQRALLYVASSANVSVGVKSDKPSKSIFKGIKIIHQTRAYGLIGLNGFGRVANYDMTQECNNRICTMQKQRSEMATSVYMETNLQAEIMFNDGSYLVTANKNRMPQ